MNFYCKQRDTNLRKCIIVHQDCKLNSSNKHEQNSFYGPSRKLLLIKVLQSDDKKTYQGKCNRSELFLSSTNLTLLIKIY